MSRFISLIMNHIYEFLCIIASLIILSSAFIIDIRLLIFIPGLYAVVLFYEFVKYLLLRKGPVNIKTPDGSDEPYHPSVLYFKNGWNGYKYWMAYTPMPVGHNTPPYVDRWECPCVQVSNDGKNFSDVYDNGYLDDLTEDEINNKGYFSDCHLVYDEKNDRLVLFYRLSDFTTIDGERKEHVFILKKYTEDGKNWSNRELVLDLQDNDTCGKIVISPAVRNTYDKYKMWYVSAYESPRSIHVSTSVDLANWEQAKHCTLTGRAVNPWHIDCLQDSGKYYMLIYEFTNELSLWESDDALNFTFKKVILKPTSVLGQFYHQGLYRSCITKSDNIKVYFSARYSGYCSIGLAEGKTLDKVKVVNAGKYISFKFFCKDFVSKYLNFIKKVIK